MDSLAKHVVKHSIYPHIQSLWDLLMVRCPSALLEVTMVMEEIARPPANEGHIFHMERMQIIALSAASLVQR